MNSINSDGQSASDSRVGERRGSSPLFWSAIRHAVFIQILLGVLTGLTLDMGQANRAFLVAMVPQWAAVLFIMTRRGTNPTSLDLRIVRYGIVPLFLICVTIQYLRTSVGI